MPLPQRRQRNQKTNSLHQQQEQQQQQSSSSCVSVEDGVNAIITCFTSPDEPADWVILSSKIYSILKIWYSPEKLRDHYFRFLKVCDEEARNEEKRDSSSSLLIMSNVDGMNNGDSSSSAITGRTIAEEKARDVLESLQKEKFDEINSSSSSLALLRNFSVKKEELASAASPVSSSSNSNKNNNNTAVHQGAMKQEHGNNHQNSSLNTTTNFQPLPNVVKTDVSTTRHVTIKQEYTHDHQDNNNNHNKSMIANNNNNINNNNNNNNRFARLKNNNNSNNSIINSSLASIWDTPQSQDFLLELLHVCQNLPDSGIFNLNVAPKVQVYLHSDPIGKPYQDVVFAPNSLQTIREKILLQSNSNSNKVVGNNSSGNHQTAVLMSAGGHRIVMNQGNNNNTVAATLGIRTVSQLYQEISKMIANCIMFNLPGGYYPMVARNFMINLMNAWADHLVRSALDHS